MRFSFQTTELEELYRTGVSTRWHPNLIKALIRVVRTISQAPDERTLRGLKGLRMEKLQGYREDHYSVRVNDQFRLIFTIDNDENGNMLVVIELVDYH